VLRCCKQTSDTPNIFSSSSLKNKFSVWRQFQQKELINSVSFELLQYADTMMLMTENNNNIHICILA